MIKPKQTTRSILSLIANGSIRSSEIPDKAIVDGLKKAGIITEKRLSKRSMLLTLRDEDALRIWCRNYDERLCNIEAYARSLETHTGPKLPTEEIELFGRDHVISRNVWTGFFIKANFDAEIIYNGETRPCGALNPVLVEKPSLLSWPRLNKEIWIVENYQCFLDISWLEQFTEGDAFVICRWPQSSKARECYCNLEERACYRYFGDMDLAGINIFQTEYEPLIGVDAFVVPTDLEDRIQHGSTAGYRDQVKFRNIEGHSKRIQDVITLIKSHEKTLIQEHWLKKE